MEDCHQKDGGLLDDEHFAAKDVRREAMLCENVVELRLGGIAGEIAVLDLCEGN